MTTDCGLKKTSIVISLGVKTATGTEMVIIFSKHHHFKNSSDFEQISGPKKRIKISLSRRA